MRWIKPSAKRFCFLFSFVFLFSAALFAQQPVLTMNVDEDAENFNILKHGDSVLLSYQVHSTVHSHWIYDGKSSVSQTKVQPIATALVGKKIFHYFFTDDRKITTLKAMVEESNIAQFHPGALSFENERVVTAYTDKVLRLICYEQKTNSVIIREIEGMRVVGEKRHILPFNIAGYEPEFYMDTSPANSFSGISKLRLYNGDKLYVVFDQRYRSIRVPGKTEIAAIPWQDGEVEHIIIPTTAQADFQSFLIDNKLFRAFTTKKKFLIRVHDIHSSKVLSQIPINPNRNAKIFSRSGRNSIVDSTGRLNRAMRTAPMCSPFMTIVKDSGSYVVLFGNYYDDGPRIPFMLIPTGGLLAATIAAELSLLLNARVIFIIST